MRTLSNKNKLDDQTIICSAKLGTGTLKVRGNVNQYYSDISDTLPKLDSTNKNKIYIQTAQKIQLILLIIVM